MKTRKTDKPDSVWKQELTPEVYRVARLKGTERPFTGEYDGNFEKGVYVCVCCESPLFESETKFASHCGWPSFYASSYKENIEEETDKSFGMVRTEVLCDGCGAHLGHVFNDGPPPTGIRYCINSVSLKFVKS